MEPRVQQQFDEIRLLLRDTARRAEQMEARSQRALEQAQKRMELAENRMEAFDRRMLAAERRMDRADQRTDRAEKQLEATRRLVERGMRIVLQSSIDIKALGKRVDALVRSIRNGHNGGNGRTPKRAH
jgi:predicted  nucleic acid-binding Zn-ribbon protein